MCMTIMTLWNSNFVKVAIEKIQVNGEAKTQEQQLT